MFSIPQTRAPPLPLTSTYEIPVSSAEEPIKNPGENFFRNEEFRHDGEERPHGAYLPGCGQVNVDSKATVFLFVGLHFPLTNFKV